MPSSISALPTPAPNRDGQNNTEFSNAVDALLSALPTFITETNQVASEMALVLTQAFTGTSTTSVAIGTGAKNFTTQPDLAFSSGQWVIVASDADPSNYMLGQVTSYDSGSGALEIEVDSNGVGGSGTFTDWSIGLVPQPISRVRSDPVTTFGAALSFNSDIYDGHSASAQDANCTVSADAGSPVNLRKHAFTIGADATPRVFTFTGGVAGGFLPIGVGMTAAGNDFTYTVPANTTAVIFAMYLDSLSRWAILSIAQED